MNHKSAPLFERLTAHYNAGAVSFHVPGHKSETGPEGDAGEWFQAILSLDVTEIPGMDDLHHPEESIAQAQALAANCFGAEETYWLVGGSTVGNMALIMAACRPGDLLLVQRDAHKSVLHALMMAGAAAVFLTPEYDPLTGLSTGLDAAVVREAVQRYPEAKGLLVTNPSYYGAARELGLLSELLHDRGMLLLVDEAHGAHFGFHPRVPGSALKAGADGVVQSTHKMLGSMTMSAMLHVQGGRLSRSAVRQALRMMQSSSPSYPLMASLDLSRRTMALQGTERIEALLTKLALWREEVEAQGRWRLHSLEGIHVRQDPLKLILSDRTGLLDGYALREALEQHQCYPELADPQHVLLTLGIGTRPEHLDRLQQALLCIAEKERAELPVADTAGVRWLELADEMKISHPVHLNAGDYIHGAERPIEWVPLTESVGRVSAEMIVPYPPGVPVLYPGERITEAAADYLRQLVKLGSRFHGCNPALHEKLPVWAEQ